MDIKIRSATDEDLSQLTEIYNHYIVNTPVTFDLEAVTLEQRAEWMSRFSDSGRYRLLVAERGEAVLGYACSGQFRAKAAYETSVETSVYLAQGQQGGGIGTLLYRALLGSLAGEDVHRAYAGITLPNAASLALHRKFGFRSIGICREVGRKFGRYWDVEWLEKEL